MFDVFPEIVEDIFITIFPGFFWGFTKQRENSAVFLDESRGTPIFWVRMGQVILRYLKKCQSLLARLQFVLVNSAFASISI